MREIKFRAWDNKNKAWYRPTHEAYKGNLWELFVSFSGDLSAHTLGGMEHQSLWPDKYDLMQYTGLKDKNGVEIYHHDLIKHGNKMCEVVWVQSMSCWKLRNRTKGLAADDDWLSKSYALEVVGNIYENKDLLS